MSMSSLPSPSERSNSYLFPTSAAETQRAGAKRTFDTVFAGSAHTQSLHNGMRPSSSHSAAVAKLDNEIVMQYRRADGTHNNRDMPDFQE